jgi:hypothetical protein
LGPQHQLECLLVRLGQPLGEWIWTHLMTNEPHTIHNAHELRYDFCMIKQEI